jgi:hypothetical protein
MEIAKALRQLSYAMLIFAGYLLFMIFVAPFGFGFATFVSAWSSFRGRSYLSATVAVFTGILLEVSCRFLEHARNRPRATGGISTSFSPRPAISVASNNLPS